MWERPVPASEPQLIWHPSVGATGGSPALGRLPPPDPNSTEEPKGILGPWPPKLGDQPVAPTKGRNQDPSAPWLPVLNRPSPNASTPSAIFPERPSGSVIITSTSSAVKTITTASSNIFPLTLNDGPMIHYTRTNLPPSANRTRIPSRRGDRRVARSEPDAASGPQFDRGPKGILHAQATNPQTTQVRATGRSPLPINPPPPPSGIAGSVWPREKGGSRIPGRRSAFPPGPPIFPCPAPARRGWP